MLLDFEESQLVLVDYQEKLMPAIFEGEQALRNATTLARIARLLQVPVFGTEQNPSKLGTNAPELRALCDKTLSKMFFSAVPEGLNEWLRPPAKPQGGNARSLPKHLQKPQQQDPERNSIVIAGCEAHVCLLQTALELLEDEFEVWVVTDACVLVKCSPLGSQLSNQGSLSNDLLQFRIQLQLAEHLCSQ